MVNGFWFIVIIWGDMLFILWCVDGVVLVSELYDDDFGWGDVLDCYLVEVI